MQRQVQQEPVSLVYYCGQIKFFVAIICLLTAPYRQGWQRLMKEYLAVVADRSSKISYDHCPAEYVFSRLFAGELLAHVRPSERVTSSVNLKKYIFIGYIIYIYWYVIIRRLL
jgi:hypothetical protein